MYKQTILMALACLISLSACGQGASNTAEWSVPLKIDT